MLIESNCMINNIKIRDYVGIGDANKYEELSKENSTKTRQLEFLKIFPKARTDDNIIDLCPAVLNSDFTCKLKTYCTSCSTCRKNYWSKKVD